MKRILFLAALALPRWLAAQGLASPFGTVSQRIDSTLISVEYYRPSVRGRSIFGGLIRWGAVWTPGANWATTLEVSQPVRFEGQPLPAGRYSIWMIPAARPDSWTVVVNRSARRFHVVHPDAADDQLRVRVLPDSAGHAEVLSFGFPQVSRTGTTLELHWAETVVPLRIEVEARRPALAAAHPLAGYAGVYELVGTESGAAPVRYEILERNNALWVRSTWREEGLDPEFDLAPAGGDQFHPRQYKNGGLVGTELDELIVFSFSGDYASGFEVRGIAEQKVLGRAIRLPPRP